MDPFRSTGGLSLIWSDANRGRCAGVSLDTTLVPGQREAARQPHERCHRATCEWVAQMPSACRSCAVMAQRRSALAYDALETT